MGLIRLRQQSQADARGFGGARRPVVGSALVGDYGCRVPIIHKQSTAEQARAKMLKSDCGRFRTFLAVGEQFGELLFERGTCLPRHREGKPPRGGGGQNDVVRSIGRC